jgi:hypothetical protein
MAACWFRGIDKHVRLRHWARRQSVARQDLHCSQGRCTREWLL